MFYKKLRISQPCSSAQASFKMWLKIGMALTIDDSLGGGSYRPSITIKGRSSVRNTNFRNLPKIKRTTRQVISALNSLLSTIFADSR